MRWVCIQDTGGQCEDISTDRTLHRHRQTHTDTHRHTQTQTDTQTHTDTQTQTAVSTAWFIRPSDGVHGV